MKLLYRRTVRFVADPYRRMKKKALIGSVAALVLLYVLLVTFASEQPAIQSQGRPLLRKELDDKPEDVAPQPAVAQAAAPLDVKVDTGGGAEEMDNDWEEPLPSTNGDAVSTAPRRPASQTPLLIRLFLPLFAGFSFGFLGSVPIAGPTSAMVLKLGIQGKYQAGLTIAFGGAISEATYAGIAFWGFGSFLAGATFLLPVSKVLGAIMFTVIGTIFLRMEVKPSLDVDADASQHKDIHRRPRDEVLKNVLLGLTMSGINPALLATYTGAIASVYGTGMLEFTVFLAFVFAIGVCCGVSTWFFLLLSLLKKYKQRLKTQTIAYIMRGMGCFLLTLGVFCAKSAIEYFFFSSSDAKA
ncbi:hypothetical protein Poli38472_005830 [Pythium oligandrum]|uniref:Uncharacterized protein n=1 Tax=Pythium oligandrum TaxID=41045 RepID=A0A8K1CRA3_PYTOL|nr:hypothetical protein Poli38472_005830 [Pythium oligandrum]|eukprot:TMW68362.1 hypothetical protein Poli38472_005830 [Pythium oligandrum]